MHTRPLTSEDSIEELAELLHRAYRRLADMGLRFWATHQDPAQTRKRVLRGECYVIEESGRLVGTIMFYSPEQTRGCLWYNRPEVASFGQFAIEPSLQGRGLGRGLMDLAERRAVETGAEELALDTAEPAHHLIDLYERCGYRLVGHAQWEGVNYRSVIMSKKLVGLRPGSG